MNKYTKLQRGVWKVGVFSLNLYTETILRPPGIGRSNLNTIRYSDDTVNGRLRKEKLKKKICEKLEKESEKNGLTIKSKKA